MNFNFPGNMHFLLTNLQGLADLKLVPSEFIKDLLGDEPKGDVDPNLEENGYSSSNFLANMGGFLVIIVLFLIGVLVLVVLGCILRRQGKLAEEEKKRRRERAKKF